MRFTPRKLIEFVRDGVGVGRLVFGTWLAMRRVRRRTAGASEATGKLLVVSPILPPSWSGQAVVLGRLFAGIDPDRYCFCTSSTSHQLGDIRSGDGALPVAYHELPAEVLLFESRGLPAWWRSLALRMQILQRAARIARVATAEGCDSVIGCTGDLVDPPAAEIGARWLGASFHLYVFDDYGRQWHEAATLDLADSIERRLMANAASVIVPNEFAGDELARRRGVTPCVVRNACSDEAAAWARSTAGSPTVPKARATILFSGAVYHVNGETIGLVARSLEQIDEPECRLVVRTAQSADRVAAAGVTGERIDLQPHVPTERIEAEQRHADVLLVPYNFDSPMSDVIRTSAPAKLGDYLASGTPILAVVPPDCFVAWFLSEHDCGVVVDEPDPTRIADAVRRLMTDHDRREVLSRNARRRAAEDFDPRRCRETLMAVTLPGVEPAGRGLEPYLGTHPV